MAYVTNKYIYKYPFIDIYSELVKYLLKFRIFIKI